MTPEARRAIEWDCTRLIYLYFNLSDVGRWEDVAALYVGDGLLARPSAPGAPISGREAILASFHSRPQRYSRHVCSNVVVEVFSEVEANAECVILLFSGVDDGSGLPQLDLKPPKIGTYHDRLVKTSEGWRFRARRGALIFQS